MRSTSTVLMARVQCTCTCTLSKWPAFFVKWEIGIVLCRWLSFSFCCKTYQKSVCSRKLLSFPLLYMYVYCTWIPSTVACVQAISVLLLRLGTSSTYSRSLSACTVGSGSLLLPARRPQRTLVPVCYRIPSLNNSTTSNHYQRTSLWVYTYMYICTSILLLHVQVLIQVCICAVRWENVWLKL